VVQLINEYCKKSVPNNITGLSSQKQNIGGICDKVVYERKDGKCGKIKENSYPINLTPEKISVTSVTKPRLYILDFRFCFNLKM